MAGCGLVPVARDLKSPSRIQYNLVFLRADLRGDSVVREIFAAYHSACAFHRIERVSSVSSAPR